jgi:hypothetical protein
LPHVGADEIRDRDALGVGAAHKLGMTSALASGLVLSVIALLVLLNPEAPGIRTRSLADPPQVTVAWV